MPRYETDGFGVRLAEGDGLRVRKDRCSETVGDAYGFRFGNANQAHGPMLQNGFTRRSGGEVQPGDVVQWRQFGSNPKSAGYRYGHLGIAARDADTGRMGYFSNFEGKLQFRSLDDGWEAYMPPRSKQTGTVQFDWDGPRRGGGSSGMPLDALTMPATPPAPLVDPSVQVGIDTAVKQTLGRFALPELPGVPDLPTTGYAPTAGIDPYANQPLVGEQMLKGAQDLSGQIAGWAEQAAERSVVEPIETVVSDVSERVRTSPVATSIDDLILQPLSGIAKDFGSSVEANAPEIARAGKAGLNQAALGPGGDYLMQVLEPTIKTVAALGLNVGVSAVTEGVLKPALFAFGQSEAYSKAVAQQLDKARYVMGGPGDEPAYRDPDLLANRPWLRESFGQTMDANLSDASQRGYNFMQLLGEGRRVPEGETETPFTAGMTSFATKPIGLAAEVALNPLTVLNPGFGLESAAIGTLENGFVRAAAPILKRELPDLAAGVVKTELRPLLRKLGSAGMRDALRIGMAETKPYAVKVARFLEDKGLSPARASAVSAELMETLRTVQRAPVNIMGYMLPKAARWRDAARESIGLTGLDYAPAFVMDAASRARRATFKEVVGMITGSTPMVPFQSEMDAYVSRELRRGARAFASGARAASSQASHFAGEAAATRGTAHEVSAEQLHRDWVAAGAKKAAFEQLHGKQGHTIEDFVSLVWPDAKFPRHFRDLLRSMHAKSRAMNSRLVAETRGIFGEHTLAEKEAMWRFAERQKRVVNEAGETVVVGIPRENALRDLLARTGELDNALHEGLANDSPEALRYIKDHYIHWRSRPTGTGANRNILKADSVALREAMAPRAAAINDTLEGPVRDFYLKMYRRDLAIAERLRQNGVDIELGEFDDYIPLRSQASVLDWMSGALVDMQMMYANTPAARQAFTKSRALNHAQEWVRRMVAAGDETPTAALITDMEELMVIRTHEHRAFEQFDEALRFLKKNAIHIGDPNARKLIEMGWQPLPRLFGKGQLNPMRQGFVNEEIGKDAASLARAAAGTDGYSRALEQAVATAADESATAGAVSPRTITQIDRLRRKLERAGAKEDRLRGHLETSGLRMGADSYDLDLIEWIVPPGVAAQWKPDVASRAATALRMANDRLGMNAFRGNLLVSPGFHVRNALDNWVGAPLLSGLGMIFNGDNLLPIKHGIDAMRVIVDDVLEHWGAVPETAAKRRLQRFEASLPERLLGGLSPEKRALYSREIVTQDLDEFGIWRMSGQAARPTDKAWRRVIAVPRDLNRRVGQTLEGIPRVATYIAAREKGYAAPEAKRLVDKLFVNYAHEIKAPLDDVLNQVFVFWPYTRKRSEQTIMALLRNPAKGVLMEAIRDVPAGGHIEANVKVPLLPQQDVGLSLLPGQAALGRDEPFTAKQRYLQSHGLRGRLSYVGRDMLPVALPDRNPDGSWDAAPPVAKMLDWVYASPAMRQLKGRHQLFVRHGLGPLEMLGKMQEAFGYGDASEVGTWLTPPLQIAKEVVFPREGARRNPDGSMVEAGQRLVDPLVRTAISGGVPGGTLLASPARRFVKGLMGKSQGRPQNDTQLYFKKQDQLRARQAWFSWGGLTFMVVAEKDMYDSMTDAEKRHYRKLGAATDEADEETLGDIFASKLRRGAAGVGRKLRGQP